MDKDSRLTNHHCHTIISTESSSNSTHLSTKKASRKLLHSVFQWDIYFSAKAIINLCGSLKLVKLHCKSAGVGRQKKPAKIPYAQQIRHISGITAWKVTIMYGAW